MSFKKAMTLKQKCFALGMLMSAAFALSAPAAANTFDVNMQWTGTQLNGITTENGSVIQDIDVGTFYNGTYGLWSGTADTSFSGAFNFYDASNDLLFTYAPSGTAGSSNFNIPLFNSVDGALTPLGGGTSLLASTSVQDLLTFTANGGADTYVLQFQDLAATSVPEPASLALLGLGLAGLVNSRRKAKQA